MKKKREKEKKSDNMNIHTQNLNISQIHSTSLNINNKYQRIVEKACPFYQLNGPSVHRVYLNKFDRLLFFQSEHKQSGIRCEIGLRLIHVTGR